MSRGFNFYPRPPGGGRRLFPLRIGWVKSTFLSTPSGWRATTYSILIFRSLIFLSTPSGWRATERLRANMYFMTYFYPRPPGGGRPRDKATAYSPYRISIHALRVEGDTMRGCVSLPLSYFYPRPPGGGRHYEGVCKLAAFLFLSTPSGWRATLKCMKNRKRRCISIHALRVEGDMRSEMKVVTAQYISIHALRVEGD